MRKGLLLPMETKQKGLPPTQPGSPAAGLPSPKAHRVQGDTWQGREDKGLRASRRPLARAEASGHAVPSSGDSGVSTQWPQESQ